MTLSLNKIIIIVLSLAIVFLLYKNVMLNNENKDLGKQVIQIEEKKIADRQVLIDSISKENSIILKEILEDKVSLEKLKKEVKKDSTKTMTFDQAKIVLGIK